MRLYLNEDLLRYKKTVKNTIINLIVLSLVVIILNVALCLLVEKINHIAIQLINTCLSTACVFTAIYKVDTVIIATVKKIKHYRIIESAPKTEFCGTIKEIGDIITVNSGLRAREICLSSNRKTYSFYLLENFDCDFNVDDEVRLTIAKKYITNSFIIKKSEKGSYA